MTSPSLSAPTPTISHPGPKLVLAAVVALIGDRLFYVHALGISLVVFLAAIAAAALVAVGSRLHWLRYAVALILLIAGLAPLVESVSLLSLGFGVVGLALSVAILTGSLEGGVARTVKAAAGIVLAGPFNLPADLYDVARRTIESRRAPRAAVLIGWLIPLALCAVFAALFATANPVLVGWVVDMPWSVLIPRLDLPRTLLWLCLLAVVWAFVAPRGSGRLDVAGAALTQSPSADVAPVLSGVLDSTVVLRCFVLFNLLFAVQSATDVAYLWIGFALPPGVTHAAYAHRGAYPLIATALLAAAFVLIALRPGGVGERSSAIRILVCLWIGQNVLLVTSAMLRLDLYVEAYGLSLLRLAALIWMALVGVGLALILARIILRRGNGWLVGANALALATTLYACAFVNFPGTVADFNAAHRLDAGQAFDLPYAASLGAAAIPAIDRVLADGDGPLTVDARQWRWRLAATLRQRMGDWRAWTFRDQRLLNYLAAHPDAPVPAR
ncbi:DUF4173 domain-containing protein [Methylobacterium sp. WL6]|nr:DUF4173 domain-containing protein [Methylobacterium sp. WL6]